MNILKSVPLLTVAAALLIGSSTTADVSVYSESPRVVTLVVGAIIDDPDPVGPVIMNPNPDTLYTDHVRPDVIYADGTAAPLAVWAEKSSSDHNIAFAMFTETGWSAVEYLTSNLSDDYDPRIFRESNGRLHVVWWRDGVKDAVYLSTREPDQTWTAPTRVSPPSESARRPSIAVVAGELRVAYERDSTQPGMAQDVVVARYDGGGWTHETLVSTSRTGALDAFLHWKGGQLWLDWKHDSTLFGCIEHDGSVWSAATYEPWDDPTWIGVEQVRKVLERHVTQP